MAQVPKSILTTMPASAPQDWLTAADPDGVTDGTVEVIDPLTVQIPKYSRLIQSDIACAIPFALIENVTLATHSLTFLLRFDTDCSFMIARRDDAVYNRIDRESRNQTWWRKWFGRTGRLIIRSADNDAITCNLKQRELDKLVGDRFLTVHEGYPKLKPRPSKSAPMVHDELICSTLDGQVVLWSAVARDENDVLLPYDVHSYAKGFYVALE